MIYYIDGYNLLFKKTYLKADLSYTRQRCIQDFHLLIKDFNFSIILVFDAYQRAGELSRITYKNIEIVYTAERQKADDFIIETFKRAKNPAQMAVVTDDRVLLKSVKSLKGNGLSLNDFFSLLKTKKKKEDEKPSASHLSEPISDYYLETFINRLKLDEKS